MSATLLFFLLVKLLDRIASHPVSSSLHLFLPLSSRVYIRCALFSLFFFSSSPFYSHLSISPGYARFPHTYPAGRSNDFSSLISSALLSSPLSDTVIVVVSHLSSHHTLYGPGPNRIRYVLYVQLNTTIMCFLFSFSVSVSLSLDMPDSARTTVERRRVQ